MARRGMVTIVLAVCSLCVADVSLSAESDAAVLRRELSEFDRHVSARDLERMMTLFADDAVILGANQPPVTGKAAIRSWWKAILEQFDVSGVHEVGEVTTLGDVVVMQGKGRGTLTPRAGGASVPVENWILHVYRREADGRLRFWRGAFGPSTTATPALGAR